MISCIGQNKICEVRGILNGTTNYILTKMFSFGDSFESALKDAQELGYAERNPDADILGTDAARKITILTALATGKLVSVDKIHTEGITKIRKEDVTLADKIGCKIKLVGRCILDGDSQYALVAPFLVSEDKALAGVCGVYNAIEVVAEPLGNVMFYGKGAGAGATASAVVGDLMQVMTLGGLQNPAFEKSDDILSLDTLKSRHYLAFDKGAESVVSETVCKADFIDSGECSVITGEMTEREVRGAIETVEKSGYKLLSHIRIL
jgi:homoserine dehydrogenase